jgi:hypothetical protein
MARADEGLTRKLVLAVAQVVLVVPAAMICGMVTSLILELGSPGAGVGSLWGDSIIHLNFACIGFVLGLRIESADLRMQRSGGMFVWIIPFALFAYAWKDDGTDLILSTASHKSLGMFFFTWPLLASVFYAVGLVVAAKRFRQA